MHFFRLADADAHLMWRSSNGKQRSIALASVFQVSLKIFCPTCACLHMQATVTAMDACLAKLKL